MLFWLIQSLKAWNLGFGSKSGNIGHNGEGVKDPDIALTKTRLMMWKSDTYSGLCRRMSGTYD